MYSAAVLEKIFAAVARHAAISFSPASKRAWPPLTLTRHHHFPGGCSIGSRVSTKPPAANSTGAILTGVAFASGWPENGSVSGATRLPTCDDEDVVALQWIGANSEPRCCPSLMRTFRTHSPCVERRRA